MSTFSLSPGEELHDVPFYYTQDRLCSLTRTPCGKMLTFRSALLNAGHRVSLSHCNKHALKTDAPNDFVWRMMRAWERENPVNRERLPEGSVARAILEVEEDDDDPKVDFTIRQDANPESRALQLKRFQVNDVFKYLANMLWRDICADFTLARSFLGEP